MPTDIHAHLEELRGQLDEPIGSARDLWRQIHRSRSLAGRASGFWRGFRERSGVYQLAAATIVLLVLIIVFVLNTDWFDWLGPTVLRAIVSIGALFVSAGVFLGWANGLAHGALSVAEHIRDQLIHDSEAEALDAKLRRTELKIEEASKRLSEAEFQLIESALPRRIARFIEERVTGGDYAEHLGIVATIRRDFEALSDLLVPKEPGRADAATGQGAERWLLRLKKQPPSSLRISSALCFTSMTWIAAPLSA